MIRKRLGIRVELVPASAPKSTGGSAEAKTGALGIENVLKLLTSLMQVTPAAAVAPDPGEAEQTLVGKHMYN